MRSTLSAPIVLVAGIAMSLAACSKDPPTSPVNKPANPPAPPSASVAAFHPLSDVSLASGTSVWSEVVIPAGVKVTLLGDATIKVKGNVSVAGTLVGDCVNLALLADGKVTLAGVVSNACPRGVPSAGAPVLRVIAARGYRVERARITMGGRFEITNDTTLTDASFEPRAASSLFQVSNLRDDDDDNDPCVVASAVFVADPARMPDGAPAKTGKPGVDGDPWAASCKGDLTITGIVNVTGQGGGDGGRGTDMGSNAVAEGGKAGQGGLLTLRSTGDILFDTASTTTLTSGQGGNGGHAVAQSSSAGDTARATGGAGNSPGLIKVRAAGVIDIGGSLILNVGIAGNGGDASAQARDGVTCKQRGGNATAISGQGGNTPDKQLRATNVSRVANVQVTGGAAGNAGTALGIAGNGSSGTDTCLDAGDGGDLRVTGGPGGDAELSDRNGFLIANGGNGGSAVLAGLNGGVGYNGCLFNPASRGGFGGKAGFPIGRAGGGGVGLAPGGNGILTLVAIANGGSGGDGDLAGLGGKAPALPLLGIFGVPQMQGKSFANGSDGSPCPKKIKIIWKFSFFQVGLDSDDEIHIFAKIERINVPGNVDLVPNGLLTGATFNGPVTLPAGQSDVEFTMKVTRAQAADLTQMFKATSKVGAVTISDESAVSIRVTAGDRYPATIKKDSTAGNDKDKVDPQLAIWATQSLTFVNENFGNASRLTVNGMRVCGRPVVLVTSGAVAFDERGVFKASGVVTIPMVGHATQPVNVELQGTMTATGPINFTVTVTPAAEATYKFGLVKYSGAALR